MAKIAAALAALALLAGCVSHTGRTSPCVCDWQPIGEREEVAV
jgi:hypothetical protein